jgi:hypothetical protein
LSANIEEAMVDRVVASAKGSLTVVSADRPIPILQAPASENLSLLPKAQVPAVRIRSPPRVTHDHH